MRESSGGVHLDLALQSGGLPGISGGQQVACQMFDLCFSDLRESGSRIFSWSRHWGWARNQLPRCVLAEEFLDDVVAFERSFDLIKGDHLQRWNIVLRGDPSFKQDRYMKPGAILPSLLVDRPILAMVGALDAIHCRFQYLLVI